MIIDLTEVLQKKKMVDELMNGIYVNMEDRAQDFKYLLKGFLEQDYGFEIIYDRQEDIMGICSPEGDLICNVCFEENKAKVLLPPGYIGSKMENFSLGHCYKLVSTFCTSWNKLLAESQ